MSLAAGVNDPALSIALQAFGPDLIATGEAVHA